MIFGGVGIRTSIYLFFKKTSQFITSVEEEKLIFLYHSRFLAETHPIVEDKLTGEMLLTVYFSHTNGKGPEKLSHSEIGQTITSKSIAG